MKILLEGLRDKLSDIEDMLLCEIDNIENNRERQSNNKFTETLENINLFLVGEMLKKTLYNIKIDSLRN